MNWKLKKLDGAEIFSVIVEDEWDLAMLFCRAQEFYESPEDRFRDKPFSIWDYIKWYSNEESRIGFTYPNDWAGFNIPFDKLVECYKVSTQETPYDREMVTIIEKIKLQKSGDKAYVIGSSNDKSSTFKHEVCHAYYSLDENYKAIAKKCIDEITGEAKLRLSINLLNCGYTEHVLEDEIQAYLMYGWEAKSFSNGVDPYDMVVWSQMFHKELGKFMR